ncbi:hypothetical protein OKC48_06885 [Methylorubrum extorquens]|uniref:hypothetical protein n=1 Tax=Methylorubrum extorquens TaxID=408 RepID=UPI002237A82D|nr:hypothetical protein [Methylorubrum extorquens]UYW28239.1 hypothetical protein OKC48_06885 [Methylorubrum extorquens]
MSPELALVAALYCYAPAPPPAVGAPVMAALRGEPVPSAKPDVAAALLALAPRRPRR